ncbi:MAG: hydroxymyristoyl-ACP dehydratase [Eudoraea sp.]|nr:hydroxymyristoyl-ACP dehydratase [Eudoraea sp.]
MNELNDILEKLPYSDPFLYVDSLTAITDESCEGSYVFKESLPFYQGHFKDFPLTPGVILAECCAQIGLVCLGIHLLAKEGHIASEGFQIAMSSMQMEFLKAVYPNEEVRVVSEKSYFRFSKLKCKVHMYNSLDEIVCKGTISGMFKQKDDG